jgi:hypothetical protein
VPYRVAFDSGWMVGPAPATAVGGFGFKYGRAFGYEDRLVKVRVPVPQPSVLTALQNYTGQDYQYSESAWQDWLVEPN